jgi:hypothetical protein
MSLSPVATEIENLGERYPSFFFCAKVADSIVHNGPANMDSAVWASIYRLGAELQQSTGVSSGRVFRDATGAAVTLPLMPDVLSLLHARSVAFVINLGRQRSCIYAFATEQYTLKALQLVLDSLLVAHSNIELALAKISSTLLSSEQKDLLMRISQGQPTKVVGSQLGIQLSELR